MSKERDGGRSLGEKSKPKAILSHGTPPESPPSLTPCNLHVCPTLSVPDLVQVLPIFYFVTPCSLSLVPSPQPLKRVSDAVLRSGWILVEFP